MGISRGTYYNHIEDQNLSFDLLEQYGRFLKYDFTQDFPQMKKYTLEEPETVYTTPADMKEAIRQVEFWKHKYLELLEKYNKVIEEKISR
jgi:hypothetical protein